MITVLTRRALGRALAACAALAGGAALAPIAAHSQGRAVRMLVPFAPGGGADLIARMLQPHLQRELVQPFFVENRAGAAGRIGTGVIAKSDPDGQSLLMTTESSLVIAPHIGVAMNYDPLKDFAPISLLTRNIVILVVHPSVPAGTLAEYMALARAKPSGMFYASSGVGGPNHLAGEIFKQMAGVDIVHVPYKGAGPALTDLLSGNIQLMFDTLGTALPPVKSGMLRPLGVSSRQRIPDLPDVPTIAESGYPDYSVGVWYGVSAPAKVPEEITKKITSSLNRALSDEPFRASLEKIGFPPLRPQSQAEIDKFIADDRARWNGVVKALNISLD
jgi:tripartite-type tricarboxylate transporter receptor subunit TctC